MKKGILYLTNRITYYLLIVVSIILFNSCETGSLEEDYGQSNIQIRSISINKFDNIQKLQPLLKSIKKKNKHFVSNKSDTNSFVIDTENILETTKDDVINYTFNLIRADREEIYFENFIISEKNNEYSFFVLKYQKNDINIEDVNLVSTIKIEENLLYTTYSAPNNV